MKKFDHILELREEDGLGRRQEGEEGGGVKSTTNGIPLETKNYRVSRSSTFYCGMCSHSFHCLSYLWCHSIITKLDNETR